MTVAMPRPVLAADCANDLPAPTVAPSPSRVEVLEGEVFRLEEEMNRRLKLRERLENLSTRNGAAATSAKAALERLDEDLQFTIEAYVACVDEYVEIAAESGDELLERVRVARDVR